MFRPHAAASLLVLALLTASHTAQARFISEDPMGFEGGDVNFYAYVGNNPINNNDPSGNFCVPCLAPLVPPALKAIGIGIGTSVVAGGAIRGTVAAAQGQNVGGAVFDGNAMAWDAGLGALGGAAGAGYRAWQVSGYSSVAKGRLGEDLFRSQLNNAGVTNFAEQVTVRGAGAKPRLDFVINSGDNLAAVEVKTFGSPLSSSQQTVFGHINAGGVGNATGKNAFIDGLSLANKPVTSFNEVRYGAFDFVRGVDGAVGGGLAGGVYNGGAAAGGYLLYPNKSNTNMMRAVYSK